MKLKSIITGATLIAVSFISAGANAVVVDVVNMTFQSGATFSGDVSFANNYSSVTGVTGILTGYQYGNYNYQGSGFDSINWVLSIGNNFSTGANNYSTFLMDGSTGGAFSNFIQFAYNYAAAPTLIFTSGVSLGGSNVATDNYINYVDPMVSGTISPFGTISSVPEPQTYAMLLAGLGLIGFVVYRRKNEPSDMLMAA
jgi:PEP-CTERM motif